MAQELTITTLLQFAKGNVLAISRSANSVKFDVAGSRYVQAVQAMGTSAAAIELNGISTPGYMFAKNLDATNTISIRNGAVGADVIDLKPGEVALFRLHAAPYGIAGAGTPQLEYLIVEN